MFKVVEQIASMLSGFYRDPKYRWYGISLTLGIALSLILFAILSASFSWASGIIFLALEAKNLYVFYQGLALFGAILVLNTLTNSLFNFLRATLKLNLREWMTKHFLDEFLEGKKNYLEISRKHSDFENPAQRIQESVFYYVEGIVDLSSSFVYALITFVAFIGTLWIIGGTLSFSILGLHVVIPGFLVWASLLFSVIGTVLTNYIGSPLSQINQELANLEADYRKCIDELYRNAESIALERGVQYYKHQIYAKYSILQQKTIERRNLQLKLGFFQNSFNSLGSMFPYIISAPLYFLGQIPFATLLQISYSFSEIQSSMNWFVDSYRDLCWLSSNNNRIWEFERLIQNASNNENPKITRQFNETDRLTTLDLILKTKQDTHIPNLQLDSGNKYVIKAPSGFGKSTFFKAIAGNYQEGEGGIHLPREVKNAMFLPQTPTISESSLKQLLSYPDDVEQFSDDKCCEILQALLLPHLVNSLRISKDWAKQLSGGEKQKIGLARALLRQPKWLFLDESFSALDEENLNLCLGLLVKYMPSSTMVAIVHHDIPNQKFETISFN